MMDHYWSNDFIRMNSWFSLRGVILHEVNEKYLIKDALRLWV